MNYNKIVTLFKMIVIVVIFVSINIYEFGVVIPNMFSSDSDLYIVLAIVKFTLINFLNVLIIFKIVLLMDHFLGRDKVRHKHRFY